MRRTASLVLLVLSLLPVSSAAGLDLGQWVPGLRLSPFLSERVEYESNVFQVPSGSQHDVIFKTIPGFLLDYLSGPYSLSVGYRAEILNYVELTGQDTVHNIAVGQFRVDLPRLTVNVRDDFVQTTDPPTSELTGPIKSTTNTLAPDAEYRLADRFSAGLNASWTHVDFQQSVDELDRDEYLFGASLFWKFRPRADVRLNYSYSFKDFSVQSERNVTLNIVTVGLRGELTPRLTSTFRIGYESREPNESGLKGFHGLVLGGDWVYRATDRTTISLLTDRSPQESIFLDNFFYVSTTASLVLQQQFGPKLVANLRVTGGKNDYPVQTTFDGQTKFRHDTIFAWGAGVNYDIRPWLRVGAEYSHTRRDSNYNFFDFADDKAVVKVTLQF